MRKAFGLALLIGAPWLVLVVSATATGSPPANPSPPPRVIDLHERLVSAGGAGEERWLGSESVGAPIPASAPLDVRVIALTSDEGQVDAVVRQGCAITHRLRTATGLVCPAALASSLLNDGDAVPDRLRKPHDLAADVYVGADLVWPSFTGTGVRVAVLDTGVQTDHGELADSIVATANFVGGPSQDQEGHGTHVAGIVTGNGVNEVTNTSGYPSPNRATGISPDAGILAGKVCGASGCFDSDIVAGMEWALANGAEVINLSLGGGHFGDHCDGDFLAQQVNAIVDDGVVVVVSSGNEASGVSSPACASKAIAVGAVYDADIGPQQYDDNGQPLCSDPATGPDVLVCFSNTGPALDLVAPGAAVLSSYSCNAPLPPGGNCNSTWYAWFWGTSMAAPHVAGAAALLLDVDPSLTPADVKALLESTARDLGAAGRDDLYGWGVIDVEAASKAALQNADPTPTPSVTTTPSATTTPTSTRTATPTPSASHTPTPTAVSTSTPTRTATRTATATPTATPTASHTPTPTSTSTPTRTATPASTRTATPTPSASHTPTPTAVSTSTPTLTATQTAPSTPTRTPTATYTATPTRTATPASTRTATPTPSASHTPTPTATVESTVDSDLDGCSDAKELQPKSEAATGGGRDPLNFWDFIDQWTGSPVERDRIITVGDIGAIVARFGTFGDPTGDPLLAPESATGYHTSADRGGAIPGQNPWNLLPPDAVIAVGDIGAVVVQFGHTCA